MTGSNVDRSAKSATKMVAGFPEGKDPAREEVFAEMALEPGVTAAILLETFTKDTLGELSLAALVKSVAEGMEEVSTGNLKRAEAMLYGQALALQAMFLNLSRRAVKQEYLKQWEAYMRMSLKAQNQCRMTLETLALLKNPPVVIAKPANINNGGKQQVNNGAPPSPAAPAAAADKPAELALEDASGPTLDFAQPTAGAAKSKAGVAQ